jgi:hypothetical protein
LVLLVTSKYPDWFIEASGAEVEPAVVGSPDTVGLSSTSNPPLFSPMKRQPVRITGADPGATVTLSAMTIDALAIDGDRQPVPLPKLRARSSWPIRTL